MARTILILGTNAEHCQELHKILQQQAPDSTITTTVCDISERQKPSSVVVSGDEKDLALLYYQLVNKLDEQVHRANLLTDLIRLFSSSLQIEEILDKVVAKSTEVLGDTAFIVLNAETRLRLEAAFSTDRDRLIQMLIATL